MSKNLTDLAFFKQNSFGDPSLYKELLEIFVKTTPEMVAQIKTAAESNDMDQLAKVAHKLKSNIQSVGLDEVYLHLDKLEQIEQQPINKYEIDLLLNEISNQCGIAVSEVQMEFDRL